MDPAAADELGCWVTKAGLLGTSETELLAGFCERAVAAGLPVDRAVVLIDTLHPVHEGRVFRWSSRNGGESHVAEYGRASLAGPAAESWQRSPFFHMVQSGRPFLRHRAGEPAGERFPLFAELAEEGQTDWVGLIDRFRPETVIGEMDCVYSSWSTANPSGFSEDVVAALKRLVPSLSLSVKSASLVRIAETLVETYLGRDAGRRVLSGRIERGVADRIEAALWFSDLRGFTRITGAAEPGQIIPFLNDYAEAVISAVHEAGGDVLKLIGDGILAIFKADSQAEACTCALEAESLARSRIAALNERRSAKGLPVTGTYLGLHVGEVFYGNIGSQDRLDFTVVGPAVNEASRIAAMCRSADRDVLVSDRFRDAASAAVRSRLVSVGRYALRGVERPAELFTLDPGAQG
ncbi:adenylate/guanylate cyclase domain-containing protein [Enterovirga sp.]|uniref:adenylate/guanylate cyclase domain-containing protein n=1 Tax=Enterovirga sp. TaxID=2026350 RepID=UPI0026084E08|nr:adenylate/guanylate cyclase domain-containing protein [Enterovirga sp.]MDB5589884.1 adenylate cyclase [Enterovirga sp.]